jgi:hypothetical protein
MLPPKPHYAWTIKTSRDLLDKATRELDRFRRSHESGDGYQVDHAMNCAITLWHVHDWLWQERMAEWQAQGLADQPAFQRWLKAKDDRGRLALCRCLANGSKHFALHQSRVDANTYVSERDVPDSKNREIRQQLAGGESIVAWSLSIEDARDVLKFTSDGRDIRADNLLEATVKFWGALFQEIGL